MCLVFAIDLHFVTKGLAVGASFPPDAVPRLAREHGISRVVDVRLEACDDPVVLREHGILLLHLPTEDRRAASREMLRTGVAFANEGLDRDERVLVHCEYGIGRSALFALCVLVARGDPPLEALRRLKDARSVISPSPEQLQAFLGFAAQVHALRRPGWAVPPFEELAAIAWRHLLAGGGLAPNLTAAEAASSRAPRTTE